MHKWLRVLVAVLLLAGSQLAESAAKYSGDNRDASINGRAEAPSGQRPISEFESKLDDESETLEKLVDGNRNKEALVLSQKIIDKLTDRIEKVGQGEWQKRAPWLLFAYQSKILALFQSWQNFEALYYSLKAIALCKKYGCNGNETYLYPKTFRGLADDIKSKIEALHPSDAFGIPSSERGDQTKMRTKRRRLITLLHPDKNMDMDEATRKELGIIFDLANRTYDELLAISSK